MLRINCIKCVYHKKWFLETGKSYEKRTNKKREGFAILSIPLLGFCSFDWIYRVFCFVFVKLLLIWFALHIRLIKLTILNTRIIYVCMYGYVWVNYLLSLRYIVWHFLWFDNRIVYYYYYVVYLYMQICTCCCGIFIFKEKFWLFSMHKIYN